MLYNPLMAIAVFTDIHGNLEALEAILKDIHKKRRTIKQTYFLGDAVTFGADSSKCLKLLQKYNVLCVMGNHEQRLVRYDKSVSEMTHAGIKHMEWVYHSLDNDDIRFIKSMPLYRTLDYRGFRLYFSHYMHDENGVVCEDMDCFREDLLDKSFDRAKIDCDIAFLGHLHERKIYIRSKGRSYFCLDASGMGTNNRTSYLFFDIGTEADNQFDFYRIPLKYDRAKFEEKIRNTDIPEKIRFAKAYYGLDLDPKPTVVVKQETEDLDD